MPVVIRAYRDRGVLETAARDLREPAAEPFEDDGLAPLAPAEPTLSRRGLLALVGAASLGAVGGLRRTDGRRSATAIGVARAARSRVRPRSQRLPGQQDRRGGADHAGEVGPLAAGSSSTATDALSLSRGDLLRDAATQHDLPIACVEGWTTTQRWTGVRLATSPRSPERRTASLLHVESLQPRGAFRQVTLSHAQASDPRSLLALKVNGADLSLDHGYPARIIVPALPGVHCTKWVEDQRPTTPARSTSTEPARSTSRCTWRRSRSPRTRSPRSSTRRRVDELPDLVRRRRRCSTTSCSCRSTRCSTALGALGRVPSPGDQPRARPGAPVGRRCCSSTSRSSS